MYVYVCECVYAGCLNVCVVDVFVFVYMYVCESLCVHALVECDESVCVHVNSWPITNSMLRPIT